MNIKATAVNEGASVAMYASVYYLAFSVTVIDVDNPPPAENGMNDNQGYVCISIPYDTPVADRTATILQALADIIPLSIAGAATFTIAPEDIFMPCT